MLVRMLPSQVSEQWDVVAPLIESALPQDAGTGAVVMGNALRAILMEDAVVWVWYEGQEEMYARNASVVIVTTELLDKVVGIRTLLVYSFGGIGRGVTQEAFESALRTLREYATALGCRAICAFTSNERLRSVLAGKGWDDSQYFLTYSLY